MAQIHTSHLTRKWIWFVNLRMHMYGHPVGLELEPEFEAFSKYILSVSTVEALARLHGCTSSPEPSVM